MIYNECIILTDQSPSYVHIANFVELHIAGKSNKETAKTY